eukprot:CAMPEP_0197852118 /NCGR_PEP_ID=MMETSP1438-20131217/19687_1 /TAXON_ID=1461541 /ORGANISM="Pterosperma sp., Strain CCMP1384" /LENGTH=157 /DNA_ID=CAMNT_0043465991 /DNA_START=30 /DNA_END=499 /DNA_ORIENTATION=+
MSKDLLYELQRYKDHFFDCVDPYKCPGILKACQHDWIPNKTIGNLDEELFKRAIGEKYDVKITTTMLAEAEKEAGKRKRTFTEMEEEAIMEYKFKMTAYQELVEQKECVWHPLKTTDGGYQIKWDDEKLLEIKKDLGEAVMKNVAEERKLLEELNPS